MPTRYFVLVEFLPSIRFFFLLGIVFLLCIAGAAETPVGWNTELNRAARWRANASGTLKVTVEDGSLRFDAGRGDSADFWVYPEFMFQKTENPGIASRLRFDIRLDAGSEVHNAFVQLAPGIEIRMPEMPSKEWKTVEVEFAGRDLSKVKVLRIGINPKGENAVFYLRNIAFFAAEEVLKNQAVETALLLRAEAPGSVFTTRQPVRFRLKDGAALPQKYRIIDVDGRETASGVWPAGSRSLELPNPGIGYYAVTLSGNAVWNGRRTFAVVEEPSRFQRNREGFFAVDSAQSWLAAPDYTVPLLQGDAYELVSDLCVLGGFGSVRERISWGHTEPRSGELHWGKYAVNARLLAERGIDVASTFHDAPKWTRTGSQKLPDDLLALYRFTRALGTEFKGKINSWEFWNEPDGGFAPEGAWDFAAAQKAAYLGFKSAAPEINVMQGGFCLYPLIPYYQTFFDNDGADYFDTLSFHTYRPLSYYPEMVAGIREMLRRNGAGGRPVWFTESGTDAEGNGKEASPVPGLRAHSPEQELLVAEFIPKSAITLQAAGVARNFFFVLPPVNERGGAKVWGLLRRDYTVEPGFVAFAALNRILGNAKCVGMVAPVPGVRGAFYKQPDGTSTLAFWTVTPEDGDQEALTPPSVVKLAVRDGVYRLTDIWGRSREVTARNGVLELPVSRFTAYLTGTLELENVVPVPADPVAAKQDKELAIVFKVELSPGFRMLPGKNAADLRQDSAPLKLRVFNLSDEPKSGRLSVQGGSMAGLPEQVSLEPFGAAEYELVFRPEYPEDGFQTRLVIGGEFNGKAASRLTVPLICSTRLSKLGVEHEIPADPARWRSNTGGSMTIDYDRPERAVRFDVSFKAQDERWVYPELPLLLPEESLEQAAGISFEICAVADRPGFPLSYLMAVVDGKGGKDTDVHLHFEPPTEKWEQRFVPLDGVAVADVKKLRIGFNPGGMKLTYWIRNLKIIRRPQ